MPRWFCAAIVLRLYLHQRDRAGIVVASCHIKGQFGQPQHLGKPGSSGQKAFEPQSHVHNESAEIHISPLRHMSPLSVLPRCPFAHGAEDLVPRQPTFELCLEFVLRGGCEAGNGCRKAHSIDELRNSMMCFVGSAPSAASLDGQIARTLAPRLQASGRVVGLWVGLRNQLQRRIWSQILGFAVHPQSRPCLRTRAKVHPRTECVSLYRLVRTHHTLASEPQHPRPGQKLHPQHQVPSIRASNFVGTRQPRTEACRSRSVSIVCSTRC